MQKKGENEMMKKWVAAALMLALLTVSAVSLGEEAANVQFEILFQYQAPITAVESTNYVIMTDKQTGKKAVFDTAGEQLSPYLYEELSYIRYGILSGTDQKDELNGKGLVLMSGTTIAEPVYAAFEVFNEHWAAAYVYSPATEEQYDVKRGKDFFNKDRCDLYYIESEMDAAWLAAALTPEQFVSAAAHGEFIAVQDSEEKITLYDKNFKACNLEMQKTASPVYNVVNYALMNMATGEIVADGFTEAKEQNTANGLWLIVTRYDFTGKKVSGIVDEAGNEILPLEYSIASVDGDYVIITENGLKGLYSLKEGRIILAPEFHNIMQGKTAVDNYVFNGYVAVEDGDLRGYYDVNAGQLSCEIKYNRKEVTTVGCSTFWKVEDGVYMLAAADGVETKVLVDEINAKTRGNGYLLLAKKGDMYGLIDWHGNEVLPFIHNKTISITDDSCAILRTGTGMEMDRVVIEQ